jgi:hypothetical protein
MKRILLSIASALAALILIPAIASASPGTTEVSGVISFNGTHVGKGILVTVNCKGNILTDKTNKSGTYLVTFTKQQCPKNSNVTVTATVNGDTGSSTGKAKKDTNKLNVAIVNVDVPEFGLITAGAATLIGGAAFMVVRRRQISGHQA